MDIRKQFQTNEAYEENGVMVDIGGGSKLLIARLYNRSHADALRKALEPYKRRPNEKLPVSEAVDILARTILLGWEGITEDGESVPYSIDKAKEYLMLKDFRATVLEIAGNMETYRAAAFEEDAKN